LQHLHCDCRRRDDGYGGCGGRGEGREGGLRRVGLEVVRGGREGGDGGGGGVYGRYGEGMVGVPGEYCAIDMVSTVSLASLLPCLLSALPSLRERSLLP
jgi:hypothetical protein